jgi:hypothetical protein
LKRSRLARSEKPLKRTQLERGKPLRRKVRIRARSPKTVAEAPARKAVRERALERAGHQCEARDVWPEIDCWGPLDVDEITARGVRPGSHLEDSQTQVLCRGHHEARHRYVLEASRRGLRRSAWENEPG